MMTKRFHAPQHSTAPRSTCHETKGEAKALEMSLRGGSVRGRGFSWDLSAVPLSTGQPRRVEM